MYLADLADYRYNTRFVLPGVQAIGWLAREHTFTTGAVPAAVAQKLAWLAAMKPLNQMRGFHRCEFCLLTDVGVHIEGVERLLGSAEIWVPHEGGFFAAPDLIVHYVRDHDYAPPVPFLNAVERLELESWNPSRDIGLDLYRASLSKR